MVTNSLLAVSGSVAGLTNASLVVTFDPKVNGSDVAGKVFTILTCANDLTATHFSSVTWTAPATKGTVFMPPGRSNSQMSTYRPRARPFSYSDVTENL